METEAQTDKVKTTDGNLNRNGRPKGVPNKINKALKEMILEALDNAGGSEYLLEQAEKNPTAFLTLIGKVLPMEMKADITTGGEKLSLDINLVRK
jgi:hypothetical protein